ncbi:MAG: translation elongation factor-like protein [Candidatus Omnitrophota bacterium]
MAETKPKEVAIGEITHFFPHVNAAVIKLKQALTEGETVHIKGGTTDFTEQVSSMQIDNKPIKEAKKGDEVGLLVKDKVRKGDVVYKVKG